MLNVNYAEDTRPIRTVTLVQPKGTWDLTLNKNAKGNRIRIESKNGDIVNVDTNKLPLFIEALNKVAKYGVKVSQAA